MASEHRILKVEPYEGDDTYLRVGWQAKSDVDGHLHEGGDDEAPMDAMYCIVRIDADSCELVDNGYSSYDDAKKAWPEAK